MATADTIHPVSSLSNLRRSLSLKKPLKRSVSTPEKCLALEPRRNKIAIVFPFEKGDLRCPRDVQTVYKRFAKDIFGEKATMSYHYCPLRNTTNLPDVKKIDGVIISGSHESVDSPAYPDGLERLIDFVLTVKHFSVPCVGICFGYQLIAKSLGGSVSSLENAHLGIEKIESPGVIHDGEKKIEVSNQSTFGVYVAHSDGVTKLPSDAHPILKSPQGHHLLSYFSPTMIGCQGHPEYSDKKPRRRLSELSGMLTSDSKNEIPLANETEPNHHFLKQYIAFQLKNPFSKPPSTTKQI